MRERGFTLFEVVVTVALAGAATGTSLSLLASSDELASDSRLRMRASSHYREAHAAVGRILQNVDIDTLSGFDGSGEATAPVFQQVTGFDGGDVTHDTQSTLKWVLRLPVVPGVGEVGNIVLEPDGQPQAIVATQVLKDSFSVRQEGRNLVIGLKIYYGADGDDRIVLEGETVVSLRN